MWFREIRMQNSVNKVTTVRIIVLVESPCHIILSAALCEIGDIDEEIRDGLLPVLLHCCFG